MNSAERRDRIRQIAAEAQTTDPQTIVELCRERGLLRGLRFANASVAAHEVRAALEADADLEEVRQMSIPSGLLEE